MSEIACATESAATPALVPGAGLTEPRTTPPAEPSFPSIYGERSSAVDTAHAAAPGLVYIASSDTFIVDSRVARIHRMRVGVCSTARVIESSFQRESRRYRKAFITLTYREGIEWSPRHITDTLKCYKSWARRRGFKLVYAWVAETQQRGAVHYHILLWLPRGVTPPLPDKQGWWKHGMSNAKWVRNLVGYLSKYLSKGLDSPALPRNARIWGSGGLTSVQRITRLWYRLPSSVKERIPEGIPVKRVKGGWVDLITGAWYRNPWVIAGFGSKGPRFRWVG